MMDRRTFLTSSCSACVLAGAGLLAGTVSSCAPVSLYSTEMNGRNVEVPISIFSDQPLQIVKAGGLQYEIAVEKQGSSYRALLLQCTHAENPLTFAGNRFVCPLHGSAFDEHGRVLKGPAERPLRALATRVLGDRLTILVDL